MLRTPSVFEYCSGAWEASTLPDATAGASSAKGSATNLTFEGSPPAAVTNCWTMIWLIPPSSLTATVLPCRSLPSSMDESSLTRIALEGVSPSFGVPYAVATHLRSTPLFIASIVENGLVNARFADPPCTAAMPAAPPLAFTSSTFSPFFSKMPFFCAHRTEISLQRLSVVTFTVVGPPSPPDAAPGDPQADAASTVAAPAANRRAAMERRDGRVRPGDGGVDAVVGMPNSSGGSDGGTGPARRDRHGVTDQDCLRRSRRVPVRSAR